MDEAREQIKEGIKAGLLWLWHNSNDNEKLEKDYKEISEELNKFIKLTKHNTRHII